ncbi:translation elongation factor Ts [Mycobacterium sp.]|uniref:translation elongation factor Ts n=1 Tax=Mycobacterium sp. TaxID=1785 RepID=UPI003340CDF2|nr:tsf [Mycobacterium sp.]
MADFTAQDVQGLRRATGAGMLDAKKALEENGGDFEAASKWLREQGLAGAGKRSDRENTQGAVAITRDGNVAAMVELKSETDFVAKSPDFVNLTDELAALVAAKGEDAAKERSDAIDELKVTLKENIELGRVVRFEAADGNILDTYLHVQSDRGVNGVLVEIAGGTQELAHDLAVHIAFGKPEYLRREDVPADKVEAERATLEATAKNEGKPEQALTKIVEGRVTGFYKDVVLLDQPSVSDNKKTVKALLDAAGVTVTRFVRFEVGQA